MTPILYVTLGVGDPARARAFYDAVLGTLGLARSAEAATSDASADAWTGYGPDYDAGVSLWLCPPFDGGPATPGNGTMVAFRAGSAAAVRAFHAAALAHGGTDAGAPGIRDRYEPTFYVAYVRDPDGNKLACVWHRYDPAEDQRAP